MTIFWLYLFILTVFLAKPNYITMISCWTALAIPTPPVSYMLWVVTCSKSLGSLNHYVLSIFTLTEQSFSSRRCFLSREISDGYSRLKSNSPYSMKMKTRIVRWLDSSVEELFLARSWFKDF